VRNLFTWHSFVYRLILGAIVLSVVIPFWASGHRPMWPVALSVIVFVAAAGILLARRTRLRDWLRRR
jgi:hypothetical protein